jgi:hypothetical protein
MLRCLSDLEKYTVSATDGDIGRVIDFLLDDERWIVRYMIADTGGGFLKLNGKRVLVSPISFGQPEWSSRRFPVALTVDKVKSSPDIDVDKPVSRQHERDYSRYYGYPYYRGSSSQSAGDMHLRSAKEVRGYHVQGGDGALGHVDDFIVDDDIWEVRYLAIDTRDWWFGKKVLIAPQWANDVSWAERKVHVGMSRAQIKDAPEWNANEPINREYEERLYDYHGRPIYWPDDPPQRGSPQADTHPG